MPFDSNSSVLTNTSPAGRGIRPRESSTLLRVAAWYFRLGGVLFAIMAAAGLIGPVFFGMNSPANAPLSYPVAFAILVMASVALFATGTLLAKRSKIGAVLGLVLTLYPYVFAIWSQRIPTVAEVLIAAVTVGVLLIVWRELDWPNARTA